MSSLCNRGMAALSDGSVIAQHLDYSLVTSASPAKPGEILIIYLAGMGPTNPSVKSAESSGFGRRPPRQPYTRQEY